MNKNRILLLISLLVAILVLGTATIGNAAEVIVKTAPPAPVSTVVIGKAPGPRHVWIGGYYAWRGGRYVWVPGRWVVPPRVGMVWVAPRWVPRNGGYFFVAGHWR